MTAAAARWGVILGFGGASIAFALWMRSVGIFSAGAAMIALEASVGTSGASWRGDLALDLPPLPVLLAMPLASLPALRWDPIAPVIVSAVAAGATAWCLLRSLTALGLGAALATVLTLAAALHPVWLYAASSGSGSVVAAALLILGLRLYGQWRRTADVLALAGSSFVIAFAGLARYDAFVVGLALAAMIALRPRGIGEDEGATALAIAYAAAVVGVLGLWAVVSALVTGDPLAFVARSRAAFAPPPASDPPIHVLLVLVPAVALASVALMARRPSAATVALMVTASAAVVASIVSGAVLSLDAVVPLVPLGTMVLGELAETGRSPARALVALGAAGLVACGGAAVALSSDWGEGHRAIVEAARGIYNPMWVGERDLAASIRTIGGRVLLDPRTSAVPALLAASPERIVTLTERPGGPGPTVAGLADLVVVRTPSGHGAADRIAAAWPTLYDGGAGWAALVGAFPASGEAAEFRLYRVTVVSVR